MKRIANDHGEIRRHLQRYLTPALLPGTVPYGVLVLLLIVPAGFVYAQAVPEPAQAAPEPASANLEDQPQSVIQKIEAVSRLSRSASSATEYSAIVEQCDQVLKTQPDNTEHVGYLKSLKSWALNRRAQTRMELAERFGKIGNQDQADQVLQQAATDLDMAIDADPDKWQAYRNRAVLRTGQGEYRQAIEDWTRLTGLRPDSEEALKAIFNRAELQYQIGQYDAALPDYRAVLNSSEQDLQALNGCGNCLLALDRPQEAIELYDRILSLEPGNAGALVNRGDARQHLQQWAGAIQDYQDSLSAMPAGRTLQRLAWLQATCPDESVCDPVAALTSIREAIALDGESAENLDTLAAALAAGGQFDQARDVQTRAIGLLDTADEASGNEYQVRQTLYENNEPFQQVDGEDQ